MKYRLPLNVAVSISTALLLAISAIAQEAKYASWGIDEYEFFGLTKQQVIQKFKSKVTFREDYQRICIAPQPGSCAGYEWTRHFV